MKPGVVAHASNPKDLGDQVRDQFGELNKTLSLKKGLGLGHWWVYFNGRVPLGSIYSAYFYLFVGTASQQKDRPARL